MTKYNILNKFKVWATLASALTDESFSIDYKQKFDPVSFTDFLLHKDASKLKELSDKKDHFDKGAFNFSNSFYDVSINPEDRVIYEYKDGKTRQIAGPQNKQSPRDYIIQKLLGIQGIKDQIDGGNN